MTIHREGPAKKTDILKLDMSGRFAVNVVDNLIMVHHQASKVSVIQYIGPRGSFATVSLVFSGFKGPQIFYRLC